MPYGDAYGRNSKRGRTRQVVLPAHIRKAIGITGRGKLLIRREGSKIVLEPYPENLIKNVEEWANLARNTKSELFSETSEESWKCARDGNLNPLITTLVFAMQS